ncbi:xanthine dehydrogenase accessory factor [Pseudomonas delhiensis]|uniref:Xanthine dehydrogenase accessory factor n=1 Tax=Pseudomonas delhiensis TaxID=366289 RepID=A0A239LTR8_9PSED|nr:XdhC family protein [Pseudomonas delhiensis]SDI26843.1 xanthine dehydrogenase accessory factor [Pseudomonas delhiensis]SNT33936.1 xanthine dehydrogenase accessory factor [Pseudomonas delhiensis]
MESIDLLVLRTARDWLAAGERVLLVTVARTWGSSPRPVGSMMALRNDGRVAGSVSGGCIEDDLIHRHTTAHGGDGLPEALPALVQYGISADEAHRFGLPCGGTLELVLEFMPSLSSLERLLARLDAGSLARRILDLNSGQVTVEGASTPERFLFNGRRMVNTLGPGYRMLLIGAGALAEYVATMALFNGFKVTICDPRAQYLDAWSVEGVERARGMPDDVVRAFSPDLRTCIIALSHDPRLDDLALLEALQSPAFYIGAIGSRRNSQSRRERLIEHFGETEASLRRLRGPIGIYIGSKTPPEIAVSVMAEVLAAKNDVSLPDELSVSQAKHARDPLRFTPALSRRERGPFGVNG